MSATYEQVVERIKRRIEVLNEILGYDPKLDENFRCHAVTFGYIGNDKDVIHFVFLPHPGRYGTEDDRIGGFRTGDIGGAAAALGALNGAIIVARHIRQGSLHAIGF